MSRRSLFLCAYALALVLLGACTSSAGDDAPEPPGPGDAAEQFVEAWGRQDAAAMSALFDTRTRRRFTALRVERWLTAVEETPGVEGFEVTLDEVDPPSEVVDGSEASAGFSIVYDVPDLEEPAELEGDLELTYNDGPDRWEVAWERGLLWPGVDGAVGMELQVEWPTRAPILDRKKRPLAIGPIARRSYPNGSVAGTTVGHIGPLSAARAKQLGEGRRPGDLAGASGLELAYEEVLAGKPSIQLWTVDRRGRELQIMGRERGRRGRSVRTTLDLDVQRAAELAYGSTTGGAVVMDPRTGDLLAVVSSSPFDPNNYVGVADIEPFNRALSGLYPPGSSLKVMTAAAALDTGVMEPTTMLSGPKEYKGVRNFESGKYESISFAAALQYSVNTAFAQVAEELGAERLTRYAERFGFNEPVDMPLGAARSSFPFPDDLGDLMWGSIGQAQVLATPMQMSTIAATIANDGKRMEPRISLGDKPRGQRVVSKKTARDLTEMMENVVNGGTGSAANLGVIQVAGKTGTAEVSVEGKIKNHAWFICFVPSEKPVIAVAVVSELGGIGGQVAAPLAARIVQGVLPVVD